MSLLILVHQCSAVLCVAHAFAYCSQTSLSAAKTLFEISKAFVASKYRSTHMLTEHCKLRVLGVEYGFLSTQLKMDVPATSLRGHLSKDMSSAVVICQPRCRWEALYTRNTIHPPLSSLFYQSWRRQRHGVCVHGELPFDSRAFQSGNSASLLSQNAQWQVKRAFLAVYYAPTPMSVRRFLSNIPPVVAQRNHGRLQ